MPLPTPAPQPVDPMTTLQNRWYNGLSAGLGANPMLGQLFQPTPPLPPTDAGLWAYENLVPPASLTFNLPLRSANTFFAEYVAVASEIVFPQSAFQQDIGASVYAAWTAYLSPFQPPPTATQLPALFQSWAMVHAPAVAQQGTADLVEMALISAAQQALTPYEGPNAKPVDFAGSFAQLQQTLKRASGAKFAFDSSKTSSNVAQTWTQGNDSGFYGLWTGYGSTARLSRVFAQSKVTVAVQFHAYTVWTATPGAWYNSSLLQTAWSSQATPPWPVHADPTWTDAFGPDGSMCQLIAALLVVDGLQLTVTSDANYTKLDQQTILCQAPRGLWPFFVPSGSAVTTAVTFGAPGMRIETTTLPGNPLVIGANVLSVARYLGHGSYQ